MTEKLIKFGDYLFNCSGDFTKFLDTILFEYRLSPHRSMSKVYLCQWKNNKFITKLVMYPKNDAEIYDARARNSINEQDTEIKILELLNNNILYKNISPCIVELIYHKSCNKISNKIFNKSTNKGHNEPIFNDIKNYFKNYISLVDDGLAYERFSFVVLEECQLKLINYIQYANNDMVGFYMFKSFLFQIIFTLYAIEKIYPLFRHGDLHINNILISKDADFVYEFNKPAFLLYTIDEVEFSIPYFGLIPKIIDFGLSKIPEEKIISSSYDDLILQHYTANNDILLLFNNIYELCDMNDNAVKNLLHDLEPKQHYTSLNNKNIDISLRTLIHNKVFKEYIIKQNENIIYKYKFGL